MLVPATLFSMFRFCMPTSRFRSVGVFGSRSMGGVFGSRSMSGVFGSRSMSGVSGSSSRSPPGRGSAITGVQRRALWRTQSHGSRCSPSSASASASSC